MALASGTRLGAYEIVSLLGAGGMGEVYRATDSVLKRQVALKVLSAEVINDPERVARFQREAEVLAALNHPNIAHLYGVEQSNGSLALAMELVEGETLADRIAKGPVPLDEALPIAKQIAEALEAAHDQGIIHRDLKPANIKVRDDGTVKVLDFGLAKALEPALRGASAANLTNSPTITSPALTTGVGVLMGTAAYMSPEQAKGRAADKRSDVWAFGCVLYEMLTAVRAFGGDDVTDTLASILKTEPDWARLPADLPIHARLLLQGCLTKDARHRVIGIAAISFALNLPAGPPAPLRQKRASSRRTTVLALTAGVSLAIGYAVASVMYESPPTPPEPVVRLELVRPGSRNSFDGGVSLALSPDGRQLVFMATEDHIQRLWIRALSQSTATVLPGTEDGRWPFWSPDGKSIAFFAEGRLKRLDLAGGPPRVLCDHASNGGAWNADGTILFGKVLGPIARVAAGGGSCTDVTQLESGQVVHSHPQFLPDGVRFVFRAQSGNFGSAPGLLYLKSLDGGAATKVLDDVDSAARFAPPDSLLAIRQNTLLAWQFDPGSGSVLGDSVTLASVASTPNGGPAFSAAGAGTLAYVAQQDSAGKRRLVWKDRTGRIVAVVVDPGVNTLDDIRLSHDGRFVLGRRGGANSGIWQADLQRHSETSLREPGDQFAIWSPNDAQLAFRRVVNDVGQLFISSVRGGDKDHLLLETRQTKTPLDWSSDGTTLLYQVQTPDTGFDVWAVKVNEGTPFPVLHTAADEGGVVFSPDGRWIAYQSNESGRPQIYVQAFPSGGRRWQVSRDGGTRPMWRPIDGRELFYLAPDLNLVSVPLTVTDEGRAIQADAAAPLFQTELSFTSSLGMPRPNYAVSADGKRFLLVETEGSTATPLTVVLHWRAAVGR